MEELKIRPARVSAALVAIGDMLVASPIGPNGPRPSTWIGAVTEHIIVTERPDSDGQMVPVSEHEASDWRQWRIGLVSGENKESAVIPADGWVWVHLPVVDPPARPKARPAPAPADGYDQAEEMLDGLLGSRPILPAVCQLDDCGCSGEAHA